MEGGVPRLDEKEELTVPGDGNDSTVGKTPKVYENPVYTSV